MYLPSKELVSEILSTIIKEYGVQEHRVDNYEDDMLCIWHRDIYHRFRVINIYELASEAKKWAWRQNYVLTSSYRAGNGICWLYYDDIDGEELNFIAKTEPEAIFKACEFILENLSY